MARFSDAQSIKQVIAMAVGAGSLCWMPHTGDLEFDSGEASKIVDDAVARLAELGVNF